jgi:hypothetical protein
MYALHHTYMYASRHAHMYALRPARHGIAPVLRGVGTAAIIWHEFG